ncbi:hypothetical protein BU15DRAFT_66346 [Melanogaster broomeanus]|nr:hypothetical protein BU15DRAFT_66346 [Melanogaster broomeanus]
MTSFDPVDSCRKIGLQQEFGWKRDGNWWQTDPFLLCGRVTEQDLEHIIWAHFQATSGLPEPISGIPEELLAMILYEVIASESSSCKCKVIGSTWTGSGLRFPALCRVSLSGGLRAIWSRGCFFNGKNAPALETLELENIVVSGNVHGLSWETGPNLTTLVWKAPVYNEGSLVMSVTLFHRIVASFPSLTTLELHGHAVGLEHVTLQSLASWGIKPLSHINVLRGAEWVLKKVDLRKGRIKVVGVRMSVPRVLTGERIPCDWVD